MTGSQASSSAKTLAVRGVIFNWMGQVPSFVIIFFLTPYLVRTLGDAQYGLWSIVMSLASYYALADLGLRGAGTKYIAQYHAAGDRESINKVVVTSLTVYTLLSIAVLLVAGIAGWVFPYVFHTAGLSEATTRAIVLLTGGTVAIRLIFQVFNAAITALQRHDIANAGVVSQQLLEALAVVLAIRWGYGLVGMAVATLLTAAVGQLTLSIVAVRLLPGMKLSPAYFDRRTLKLVFSYGSVSVLVGAAGRIAEHSGALIVGVLLGPTFVTFFAIADALTKKAVSIGRGITGVILPLASQLESTGKQEQLKELLVVGPRILLAFGLSLGAILIALGKPLITLWLGPKYVASTYPVLCILAISSAAVMFSSPIYPLLRGIARQRTLLAANSVKALTTIIVGIPLTYEFGTKGMAFAVAGAALLASVVIIPVSTCRVLEYPPTQFFKNTLIPSVVAAIPAALMSITVAVIFPPKSLAILLVAIASIAIITVVSVFVICLSRKQQRDTVAALLPRRSLFFASRSQSDSSAPEKSFELGD